VADQVNGITLDENWDGALEDVRELFGLRYHAEIVGTHGGRDGKPDPYCKFAVIFDGFGFDDGLDHHEKRVKAEYEEMYGKQTA
jgi:hypothetical protein